jgi:hypothetical protein
MFSYQPEGADLTPEQMNEHYGCLVRALASSLKITPCPEDFLNRYQVMTSAFGSERTVDLATFTSIDEYQAFSAGFALTDVEQMREGNTQLATALRQSSIEVVSITTRDELAQMIQNNSGVVLLMPWSFITVGHAVRVGYQEGKFVNLSDDDSGGSGIDFEVAAEAGMYYLVVNRNI